MNWLEKHPSLRFGLINPNLEKTRWCGIFGHLRLYAEILNFLPPENCILEEFKDELETICEKAGWIRFVLWEKQKTMIVDKRHPRVRVYLSFLEELAEAWGYELEIR